MDYISSVLQPVVAQKRLESLFQVPGVMVAQDREDAGVFRPGDHVVGLNTVGMLLDRMSILAIKAWNLEHRSNLPDSAEQMERTQVAELVQALADARPGHSSTNNKLTSHSMDAAAETFPSACYDLVTTNLLLWEAQEILYNHDIAALPSEELRRYIQFFSKHNLARNVSIEAADRLYWTAIRSSLN